MFDLTESLLKAGWCLRDIDESEYFSLLDYSQHRSKKYITVGGKQFIKKTADKVNWL